MWHKHDKPFFELFKDQSPHSSLVQNPELWINLVFKPDIGKTSKLMTHQNKVIYNLYTMYCLHHLKKNKWHDMEREMISVKENLVKAWLVQWVLNHVMFITKKSLCIILDYVVQTQVLYKSTYLFCHQK